MKLFAGKRSRSPCAKAAHPLATDPLTVFALPEVRRPRRKLSRKFEKVQIVPRFKRQLANLVLLEMVELAEADRPFVAGLESKASIGAAANMSAFDRQSPTACDRTAVCRVKISGALFERRQAPPPYTDD